MSGFVGLSILDNSLVSYDNDDRSKMANISHDMHSSIPLCMPMNFSGARNMVFHLEKKGIVLISKSGGDLKGYFLALDNRLINLIWLHVFRGNCVSKSASEESAIEVVFIRGFDHGIRIGTA